MVKKPIADRIEYRATSALKPDPRNSRTHPADQIEILWGSYQRYGWTTPILIQPNGSIIAGAGRHQMATLHEIAECKVLIAEGWSKAMVQEYIILDNQSALLSGWDQGAFAAQVAEIMGRGVEPAALGFTQAQLDSIISPRQNTSTPGSLSARFGIPPFTVMNAREGWWQDRKSAWIALGIQSELGRGDVAPGGAGKTAAMRQRGRRAAKAS